MNGLYFLAWSELSRRTRDLANVLGARLVFLRDKPLFVSMLGVRLKLFFKEHPNKLYSRIAQELVFSH